MKVTYTGGADQVVGVCPGHVRVVGHTAHHHNRLPPGPGDLDLGVGLPVLGRALALQRARASALALVSEPQAVRLWLLQDSDPRLELLRRGV